jgi:hypothetical protein
MKQFAFMLTLSLISVFSLQAQSSPAKSDDGAKITFDKEVVDYGTIKQGADPLRTFKFKNTGAGPLVPCLLILKSQFYLVLLLKLKLNMIRSV